MAKAIFLHNETEEFQSLAQLESKYQKQNALLGQMGVGCTYKELMSGKRTRNIINMIQKEFPRWADLHGWWHTNPMYNSTWSSANSGQNFSVCVVELFKLQQTPPLAANPESHLPSQLSPSQEIEDREIANEAVPSPPLPFISKPSSLAIAPSHPVGSDQSLLAITSPPAVGHPWPSRVLETIGIHEQG
ncbi:hypothetical protein EDD17DRAFT_1516150 [Pisolithus thermaeus]|nr:hypothetical protein EDD17DRAFT_1516150 [Pisolithus thermaeus]